MAIIQGIIIIALEAVIASQNVFQANETRNSSSTSGGVKTDAFDRLYRIKWENVAFIGFQVWTICMVLDATVQQNAAEVFVLGVFYILCAILGGLQISDSERWIEKLIDASISVSPLRVALTVEIALTVLLALFAISFTFVSYKIMAEFGWVIYKKIGADIAIQKMYVIFQYFVLCLKINIFVEFLVLCFYLIQFVIKGGGKFDWHSSVFLVVTILILPMLYLAREAVSQESKAKMIIFILFQFVVIFSFIIILIQTMDDTWYIWTCFVFVGVIFALTTCIFGVLCIRNFDRGLHRYVQRGESKKINNGENDPHEMKRQRTNQSWHIDED
ncbi:hypothetical protein BJ944DRAFT_172376 [Cunninghamella echinulata]|nr:hypothetical protein BJ944DRAFT_172376 [Cunninghamella echinulata]